MTILLAIDTATTACSVALSIDGDIRQQWVATPREHTRLVLPMVDALLAQAGVALGRVDAIAFTAGPGSFTGLRIGFGVVQGLAFGADLPVVPVSTLAVLARAAATRYGLRNALVVPALDARMGEVYWGVYRVGEEALETVRGDAVDAPSAVAAGVGHAVDVGVGDGWGPLSGVLGGALIDASLTPDAASTAALAAPIVAGAGGVPVEQAELLYIRNEVTWKKRQKIRTPSAETP